MAAQGYLLALTLADTTIQFQNVSVDLGGSNIDTSASLNPDGSYNEGFSDTSGDLRTLTVDINSVIKDAFVLAWLGAFQAKVKYLAVTYEIDYEGYNISGEGIFVDSINLDFGIPGGARARMRFMSIQPGYAIT